MSPAEGREVELFFERSYPRVIKSVKSYKKKYLAKQREPGNEAGPGMHCMFIIIATQVAINSKKRIKLNH